MLLVGRRRRLQRAVPVPGGECAQQRRYQKEGELVAHRAERHRLAAVGGPDAVGAQRHHHLQRGKPEARREQPEEEAGNLREAPATRLLRLGNRIAQDSYSVRLPRMRSTLLTKVPACTSCLKAVATSTMVRPT